MGPARCLPVMLIAWLACCVSPALRPVTADEKVDPRAVYHDDVADYATNEPTMDGTASAILMWSILQSPPSLHAVPANRR
jgi:hypothetical protein